MTRKIIARKFARTQHLLLPGLAFAALLCLHSEAQNPGPARHVRGQLWQQQVNLDAEQLVQPGKVQRQAPAINRQDVRKRIGQDIQKQLKQQTRNSVKQIQRNRIKDLIRDRSRQNLVQQQQRVRATPSKTDNKNQIDTTRKQTSDPASDISQRRISIAGAETGVDSTGNKVSTQPTVTRTITKLSRKTMRKTMTPTVDTTPVVTVDTQPIDSNDNDRTVKTPTIQTSPPMVDTQPIDSDIQPTDDTLSPMRDGSSLSPTR